MALTMYSEKVDHNIWKCTCDTINDWGVPCSKGHGHADLSKGDIRLWECSSCGRINDWDKSVCTNSDCKGMHITP
jgi:hypothetical protein